MHPSQAYKVPKRSPQSIIEIALKTREQHEMPRAAGLKAVQFMEALNAFYAIVGRIAFDIIAPSDMAELGMYDPMNDIINIREDVYDRACDGCVESLYTIVHECGHMQLHSGAKFCRLERLTPSEIENLHPNEHSEDQADLFACALNLHPDHLKFLLNRGVLRSSIAAAYKMPLYQLERYIERLSEECGYTFNDKSRRQMELTI